jgi:hypothetical protein
LCEPHDWESNQPDRIAIFLMHDKGGYLTMAHSQSDTVHVFDTWVKGTKRLLHFDVMTTDEATALTLAKQHLASIGEGDVPVTVKECQFCHTEPLVMFSPEQQRQFREQGGFIITLST